MSDIEVSPTLTSLEMTRPRPRRNHKPSTPSALSPSFNLPSLFDDDQLSAFFPSLSPTRTTPHDLPSASPSVESKKERFRYPSVFVEEETREEEERTQVEEKKEEEEEEVVGDEGERNKERQDDVRIEEEKVKGQNYGMKEEEGLNYIMKEKEKEEEDGGRMKEDKDAGEEEHVKEEEAMKEEHCAMKKMEEDDDAKDEEIKIRFPSLDDDYDVFADDDEASSDSSINEVTLTSTHLDYSSSSPLPAQSSETNQKPSLRDSNSFTPDSIPESYTTDANRNSDIRSPVMDEEKPPSRDSTSFTPDSIPESYTTDANSDIRSPVMDSEEDLCSRFVYPPNLSRLGTLGSIYSNLSSHRSCVDSSSECESDACVFPSTEEAKDCEKGLGDGNEESNKGKDVMGTDREDGGTFGTPGNSSNKIPNNTGSVKGNEKGKKPPPKPPRLRATPTTRNEDKRRSREDPIRYTELSEGPKCNPKRSVSMADILESNFEPTDERYSLFSRSPEEKAAEVVHSPDGAQDVKKHRRHKSGGSKIRDAAKMVSSIMSKKQHFLHRKDAIRPKNPSPNKTSCKDVEGPPSSSPPPPPLPPHTLRHDASHTSQMPKKPPRNDLNTLTADSLDKAQETCAAHGALLHFYCVKCRVVVCRDCTVVAHSHSENHKVLDTQDSLNILRSEAVTMLRHYTILETMHASLAEIYRKFKVQHRDANIAAIGERLEEGKYIAGVVKEAEHMVKTWTNLEKIRDRVRQWEARQDEWGDLVFLASRCSLLADMHMPCDTVLLRMGNWVMPTPWIQLSHLLQPYLRTSPPRHISPSSNCKDDQLSPGTSRREAMDISPHVTRKRNKSPYGGGGTNTGGTDRPFPYNARQTVLSNLVPYIILNPHIRYFVHIGGPRDVDLTLVVVPTEDHANDCLKQRRSNAIKSPEMLRQANHRPAMDAITLVEQQMTCGSCRTRFTASSMPLGPSTTPTIVKVNFSDVKILSDGGGLTMVRDGVKRGDMIVDHGPGRRPTLTVVVKDIGDFPALRIGRVTWGMDGLTCLVGTEDTRRAETSGFRAKIKATVKREEETMYDVMFGMDL